MRIIVQFQSDEDKASFAAKHRTKANAAPDGGIYPFRVIRELSLAPIMILESVAEEPDQNALDGILPKNAGIVFKELETDFFLSASSANMVLGMDPINTSVYGPFQGDGVTIAIIDGGIRAAHPDLDQGSITRKEYIDGSRGFDAGHGTAIAGIICGSGKMSRGRFKGITRNVKLLDCVAFDARGRGLLGDILSAIDDAVGNGIRVICMPFSSRPRTNKSAIFEHYLRLLEARATIFCCGTGNHGPLQGTIGMPGCYDCVLTTGSTSPDFKVSHSSGRGNQGSDTTKPDFCLPGEQSVSLNDEDSAWKVSILDENEHYSIFSGNSVSVAILTGLVVAVLSAKPDAKPSAVKQLLVASCARIRKFAPISAGKGLLVPTSVFRNLNLLYAFEKGFPTIAREAVYATTVVLVFSIATALMIASFL